MAPNPAKTQARTQSFAVKFALLAIAAMLAPSLSPARSTSKHKSAHAARRKPVRAIRSTRHRYRHYYRGVPTYMADPAIGDDSRFDDPIVRQAALDAIGRQNGSVVAVDPSTGRILTIVNQKLAYSAGFEPCSTTKPIIAVAALEKGIVTPDTMIKVGRRRYMDMTEALAHSNNAFFEELGRRLGFDNVWHYDHVFGLGERAGYEIAGEQPGFLPEKPPVYGGVARMCSFGEGIKITPLQLAAVVSAIANGGTMYYLQYPATEAGAQDFAPRVRRTLPIAPLLPELRQGMLAAVLYGTARQSNDPEGEQTLGKTGTCNDETKGGRLGWFASYADQDHPKLVVVVLLRGGAHIVSGPHAADVAGKIYHDLYQHNYFADKTSDQPVTVAADSER
ncbi:MAG TPA: penicillin-binding transpeptidase domain-containing protein [Candidatus Acidoferrales bacterium]|nr:penicillin-binding transpeptidase domain-containing protein [Candidatus Acidoferrales bacterium]